MTIAIVQSPDMRFEVNLFPLPDLSEDGFAVLCQANPDLRLERTAKGEVLVMPPEGGESGYRSLSLGGRIYGWAEADERGVVFGSSVGFRLPNGAVRSPDVSWVRRDRLAALSAQEKREFLPLCPDFVIEVRSPTDRLPDLFAKMEEYVANGTRLGWLIDPDARTVHVYRPDRPVEALANPARIVGDPELPGLVLELGVIWEPPF